VQCMVYVQVKAKLSPNFEKIVVELVVSTNVLYSCIVEIKDRKVFKGNVLINFL
jgi:hypothetical protein